MRSNNNDIITNRVLEGYVYFALIGWDTQQWRPLTGQAQRVVTSDLLIGMAGNAMSAYAMGPCLISAMTSFCNMT